MDKIQLMKVRKNFMRPKFARSSKSDTEADKSSPAMYVGLVDKILSFEEVFPQRRFKSHAELDGWEEDFYERRYDFSRRAIAYL